jgi:hypothetical protein
VGEDSKEDVQKFRVIVHLAQAPGEAIQVLSGARDGYSKEGG